MDSEINIRTGNEYVDKKPGLSRIYSTGRNYKQSKAVQSSLMESNATYNETEKENAVRNGRLNASDELLTNFNHLEAMDGRNNSGNIFNYNWKATSYQQCLNTHGNVKNGSFCDVVCKTDNYKSGAIGIIDANERARTKANETTQISKSIEICQKAGHCSKSMHRHRQAQPERNFVKSNAYSHQKCICKEINEQSSRKHRPVKLSTIDGTI
ncbi:hypothetical protein DINM_002409 [Dirofilaria immitis]|nr:hypothetical protein [Dirofilaria immitis]